MDVRNVKYKILRRVARTTIACLCAIAPMPSRTATGNDSFANDYRAPARWNTFHPATATSTPVQIQGAPVQFGFIVSAYPVAMQSGNSVQPELPAPATPPVPPSPSPYAPLPPGAGNTAMPTVDPLESIGIPTPAEESVLMDAGDCQTCAPAAPCCRPLCPWFGGINAVYWDVAGCDMFPLVTDDNGQALIHSSGLDPDSDLGYEVFFGRYLKCGCYALEVGYTHWDPDVSYQESIDTGSGLRLNVPALNQIEIDRGGGPISVYDDFDTNAATICTTRDFRMQGLELNLNCFGLMGSRRLGSNQPYPVCSCLCGVCGCGNYGGRMGPMTQPSCSRLRVALSHGIRWLQIDDELDIIGDVDGTPGIAPSDLHYFSHTQNNMLGYQFGTSLAYCLSCRCMLTLGGKFGIYGNEASYYHRVTTDTVLAYTPNQGPVDGEICIDDSEVCWAGLSELDFGIGYRVCARWTLNAGYRFFGAYGVATAIGEMPIEYSTVESAGAIQANDNLMLHGVYFGIAGNW